jgi:hypothetical protein
LLDQARDLDIGPALELSVDLFASGVSIVAAVRVARHPFLTTRGAKNGIRFSYRTSISPRHGC